MSEFPYYNFNTKRIREHLIKIGIQNAIKGIGGDYPNVFMNNGKHLNYSATDKYKTCGASKNEDELCSKDSELQCFRQRCCLHIKN